MPLAGSGAGRRKKNKPPRTGFCPARAFNQSQAFLAEAPEIEVKVALSLVLIVQKMDLVTSELAASPLERSVRIDIEVRIEIEMQSAETAEVASRA